MKKLVVIGGGTGTYTVLTGLRMYPLNLSVIVSMMDSGGSNRVIRDEFGLLPTSDIRQCIVALASPETDKMLRELFTYRYSLGTGISGMTFGNLFMAALTDIYGSQKAAIEKTCQLFDVVGSVIPITYSDSHLLATYESGLQILGEHFIDEPINPTKYGRITNLSLIPKAKANPDAISTIQSADYLIIGPGDVYTSIVCNFLVDGIRDAIKSSKVKIIYILNLMTKPGQTDGFGAYDHIKEIENYIGRKVDICVVNKAKTLKPKHLSWYAKFGYRPVANDLVKKGWKGRIVVADIVSEEFYKKEKSDKLVRSLIRHDSAKLAKVLYEIV